MTPLTMKRFVQAAQPSLQAFNRFVSDYELLGQIRADHISYKCGSEQTYKSMRAFFEPRSVFVYQSFISRRRIAYIRLLLPLQTLAGNIEFLELSDQKPTGSQTDGFDHFEICPVNYQHPTSYERLIERLSSAGISIQRSKRPHHETDDIILPSGLEIRCEGRPLIDDIVEEMCELRPMKDEMI